MNIKSVSEICNISVDTLRYYEKVGLIPKIKRNENGIRIYNEKDIIWVNFIKCMRSAGLPIDTLKEYVILYEKGDEFKEERKAILIKERENLIKKKEEIENTLSILDKKIENYTKVLDVK